MLHEPTQEKICDVSCDLTPEDFSLLAIEAQKQGKSTDDFASEIVHLYAIGKLVSVH